MSTSIVIFYTGDDGYMIAADGRALGGVDPLNPINNATKIFDISRSTGGLAFALSGNASIVDGDGNVAINLVDEISVSANNLKEQTSNDLAGFATKIARTLHRLMRDYKRIGKIPLFPVDHEAASPEERDHIAWIHFAGYWNGFPQQARVRLYHRDQELQQPNIYALVGWPEYQTELVTGSSKIVDAIQYNPAFIQYRPDLPAPVPPGMKWCLDYAKKYISACASDAGVALDEKCKSIGGHIHIATIARGSGFRWIEPPVTVSP